MDNGLFRGYGDKFIGRVIFNTYVSPHAGEASRYRLVFIFGVDDCASTIGMHPRTKVPVRSAGDLSHMATLRWMP